MQSAQNLNDQQLEELNYEIRHAPQLNTLGPILIFRQLDHASAQYKISALIVSDNPVAPQLTFSQQSSGKVFKFDGQALHKYNGFSTFWRTDVCLPVAADRDEKFTYIVSTMPGQNWGVCVPALNRQAFNMSFYSCNGFSLSTPQQKCEAAGGLEPLWQDLLIKHAADPFHVLIGGGDQLYNDAVWKLPALKDWLNIRGSEHRHNAEWKPDMEFQVQQYYFNHYMQHFTLPAIAQAMAQIPSINISGDHDIFDGVGSYPEILETSNVFTNMKRIAGSFYLLFQHCMTSDQGVEDGYLVNEAKTSFSSVKMLGTTTALAVLDTRGERTQGRIVSEESYAKFYAEVRKIPAGVKHLLFLSEIPIVYPHLNSVHSLLGVFGKCKKGVNKSFNFLQRKMLGSLIGAVFGPKAEQGLENASIRMKDFLGKKGLLKSVVNEFGIVELNDDLVDHWGSANHNHERIDLIENLQVIAKEQKLRITFLGGDVHLGCIGRIFDKHNPENDTATMYQVTSSAIGNLPPPDFVVKIAHKNSGCHKVSGDIYEEMVKTFNVDVDGRDTQFKILVPRRNYCIIRKESDTEALKFSLQVEAKDYKDPSVPYVITIPAVAPTLL
ncbi:hypothetical protein MIR68_001444 [Amoeboaphelidium protococcarum]|nr:hypothetical protein MIR68_001444 [Amoeboaphelidium protococcarum]